MNDQKSLLTINESSTIKGLLIFLIILGHNMFFTYYALPFRGMEYLYCFHIQAFFILPFLYNSKHLSWMRVKNYFVRFYWPFIILSIILFIINIIYNKINNSFSSLLFMWYSGNPELIKKCCGIQILWFMPAMLALSIIKDYYYQSKFLVKTILLLISIFSFILNFHIIDNVHFVKINLFLTTYIPFGFYIGIPYLVLGIITRDIINFIYKKNYSLKLLISLLFISCTIIYLIGISLMNNNSILNILKIIMPIIFILLIWSFRNQLIFFTMWSKLGNKSYAIYLIHPFIGYILFFIFLETLQTLSWWLAITSQIIIIFISYILSKLLYTYPKIRKFILPKNISDIKDLYLLKPNKHAI